MLHIAAENNKNTHQLSYVNLCKCNKVAVKQEQLTEKSQLQ